MQIEENLSFTRLSDRGTVVTADVMIGLNQLEKKGAFDIIHMDPPYEAGLERNVLSYLKDSKLVKEDTLIILEASNKTDLSYIVDLGYIIEKEKIYKHNRHLFLKVKKSE